MATSAFWYQHKAHLLCVESTQYGLSEKTGLASSFQQGGWLRVWNTACLGMLIYLHPPRPPYYPCVNGRKYVASNGRCHDVNNFSPALLLSDRRRCERANRSCNALSSSKLLHDVCWIDRFPEHEGCFCSKVGIKPTCLTMS